MAYLVSREGSDLARSTFTALLWGDRSEAQARASLRQALSELRAAIAPATQLALVAKTDTIAWQPGAAWVDTKALELAVRLTDDTALQDAAGLYGGDFLEGLPVDEPAFEQWLAAERERLRMLACTVHTRLRDGAEARGQIEEALTFGLRLVALDPLQEHVHRALMRLYVAQGRHDAALSQFERCKRELSAQLSVEPQPETVELARTIKAQRRETPAKPIALEPESAAGPTPALPTGPSIAVLPFANLTSDREQDFFADGMTEEIISALSKIGDLFVISKTSSMLYQSRAVRAEDAARELGVQYVLEGCVRVAGNRVRVMAQLIDGLTGGHTWSERYDGDINDIFAVQDEITRSIAVALHVKLTFGESARLWEGRTLSLRAWEKMVDGRREFLRFNTAHNSIARRLLEEALEIDPGYTSARALLALTHWWDARFNTSVAMEQSLRLAELEIEKLVAEDPEMAAAYMVRGGVALMRDRHDDAIRLCEKSVERAPSDSHNMAFLGIVYRLASKDEEAIAILKAAMRLSPHYPAWYTYHLAVAQMWLGVYAAAQNNAEIYVQREPDEPMGLMSLATIHGMQGREADASETVSKLNDRFPEFGMKNVILAECYKDKSRLDMVVSILSKAGLR